jgi:hypothetical protein
VLVSIFECRWIFLRRELSLPLVLIVGFVICNSIKDFLFETSVVGQRRGNNIEKCGITNSVAELRKMVIPSVK